MDKKPKDRGRGRILPALGVCLGLIMASAISASALSVEQVLALKKAGVGEKTIRALMDAENAAQARGQGGSYVLRPFGGREWIVYESATSLGVEEYPLDLDPGRTDLEGVGRALGASPDASASSRPPRASGGAQARSQGFTLLLGKLAERQSAESQVSHLVSQGLLARLLPVVEAGQGRRFLVLAGSYPDQDEARAQGERLRQEGKIGEFEVIPQ